MRCAIVDDDELSIRLITEYINQTDFLNLVGAYSSAIKASNVLLREPVDLIFLDVEMPDMTGLELIKSLDRKPQIILITSKKDYAIEAFEHQVADYLLKPVGYSRFLKAVTKARELFEVKQKSASAPKHLYIKEDSVLVNVALNDIVWIEALGDYVTIHLTDKKHTVLTTMKAMDGKLPSDEFMRVHRSFIVRVDKINNLDGNMLVVGKKLIPIGKSYRKALMDRLNIV
jgi:DNA-binding LytR/AlgR family response regulator